ncbi:hypothetical protein CSA17_06185 [bacterium DOLJORAL78_65_58]|nr:MAG: hypothetical protein CSB20_07780 [bacterium DOLZORAL124_64_63]PIE75681.1 MAG: hypothetical protein CSA17_06185 [bacterium DOLJORAL78_65_58]
MTMQQLTDRYLDGVFRFILSLVRDAEAAADLTQDAFLKLQRAGGHPSEAYVMATARNTVLSWLRRRALERRHVDVWAPEDLEGGRLEEGILRPGSLGGTPDRVLRQRELGAALAAALDALPRDLREVFHLSEMEGLRYEQIAEVVGCPVGTVASRKHLAVRKLREHLERSGHAL